MSPAPPLPAPPAAPSAAAAGAYAGTLERLEPIARSRSALAFLRRKRWVYVVAASDEALAAAAVVDGGWFAGAFAWAVDRASGALLFEASSAGIPVVNARVAGHTAPGALSRFRGRGLGVRIECDGRGWLFEVECPRGSVDAALEVPRGVLPLTFVTPVVRGGLRATEKSAALAASGVVRVRGRDGDARTLSLDGGRGGVDATAGVLARETRWRWAFGNGVAAGEPFAFNLCEGFGVPADDAGENAAFQGGAPFRLPPVEIRPGGAEWRISSRDGSVDLAFRPIAAHRERRNLGVLRTRFLQVAGTFEGTMPGRDGAPVSVRALPGVAEDHFAVW